MAIKSDNFYVILSPLEQRQLVRSTNSRINLTNALKSFKSDLNKHSEALLLVFDRALKNHNDSVLLELTYYDKSELTAEVKKDLLQGLLRYWFDHYSSNDHINTEYLSRFFNSIVSLLTKEQVKNVTENMFITESYKNDLYHILTFCNKENYHKLYYAELLDFSRTGIILPLMIAQKFDHSMSEIKPYVKSLGSFLYETDLSMLIINMSEIYEKCYRNLKLIQGPRADKKNKWIYSDLKDYGIIFCHMLSEIIPCYNDKKYHMDWFKPCFQLFNSGAPYEEVFEMLGETCADKNTNTALQDLLEF